MNSKFRERRQFIKLASGLLVSPFVTLSGERAFAANTPPLRMLTIIDSYGLPKTTRSEIWVRSSAGDYALQESDLGTILAPFRPYKDNLLVASGINMDSLRRTGDSGVHHKMTTHTLTGSRLADSLPGDLPRQILHPSLDIRVGQHLNNEQGFGRAFSHLFFTNNPQSGERTFCHDGAGNEIRSIAGAKNIATTLFSGNIDEAALQFQNQTQQSILDLVQEQVRNIRGQLTSANSNEVIDAYQTSVSELAAELQVRSNNVCQLPTGADSFPDATVNQSTLSTPPIFENIYQAFACNLTSSLTYAIGGEMINQLKHRDLYVPEEHDAIDPDFGGFLNNRMHAFSHSTSARADKAHEVVRVHQAELIRELLDKLSVTPDVDGNTLMDNTVVFWTSAMANNIHSSVDYPQLLIAGKNANLRSGYHYDCAGSTNNDLLTTIAQGMNLPDQTFGGHNRAGVYLNDLNNGPITKMLAS